MQTQEKQIQTPAGPVEAGDLIGYRDRTCRVTAVYDNVKNGRPGFDAVMQDGQEVWGYAEQVTHLGAGAYRRNHPEA